MTGASITYRAGSTVRIVRRAGQMLVLYRDDTGYAYLNYDRSPVAPDAIAPEDLAVTLLMNSQVGARALLSFDDHRSWDGLSRLPRVPLERTTAQERQGMASVIAEMCCWPGVGVSVATKVLHKKRPDLIPVLDNQAIFGAYLNPAWPRRRAWEATIKEPAAILRALNSIQSDLVRPENSVAWSSLATMESRPRSVVQLFDCIWWEYFRTAQPVMTEFVRTLRKATVGGTLPRKFKASEASLTYPKWVGRPLDTYRIVLWTHRQGNSGGYKELFIKHGGGRYSLA